MPKQIITDHRTFLIYKVSSPIQDFTDLRDTKDLFLKAKKGAEPIVIVDGSFEGDMDNISWKEDWVEINSILYDYWPSHTSTVLLYGDANIEKNYATWCRITKQNKAFRRCIYNPNRLLERSLIHYEETKDDKLPRLSFKPKHFICMNAVSKPHRFDMVELLFANDWNDKGYISYLNRDQFIVNSSTEYFQAQTLHLDFNAEEIKIGNNQLQLPPQYREVCFDIVNESTVSDTSLFITEKTWKPILNKTPFIPLGSKGMCKHLEEYFGIKPYTDLFDYSFDNLDYPERLYRLKEDNLKRLLNMDIHELNEIVNSDKMQKLLSYNQSQLLSFRLPRGDNFMSSFINIIEYSDHLTSY